MRKQGGFTIIEVMIVLAVTGVLLISILGTVSGRQGKTQFSQGMRELQSTIRDTLSEVGTGLYPPIETLKCQAPNVSGNPAPRFYSDPSSPNQLGINDQCIYAGKVLQFGVGVAGGEKNLYVYTLAGRRQTFTAAASTNLVSNFNELKPAAIHPLNTLSPNPPIDATVRGALPWNISVIDKNGAENRSVAFGVFYQSFGGQSFSASDPLASGVSNVAVARVGDVDLAAATETWLVSQIASVQDPTSFITSSNPVVLCFKSGTSKQTAVIKIGEGASGMSVDLQFDQDLVAAGCPG